MIWLFVGGCDLINFFKQNGKCFLFKFFRSYRPVVGAKQFMMSELPLMVCRVSRASASATQHFFRQELVARIG